MFHTRIFEFVAEFIGDDGRSGEHRDIFEHLFFAVSESRSLDGEDIENTLEFIEDDSCKCISFHIFRDDDEIALTGSGKLFEDRKKVFE